MSRRTDEQTNRRTDEQTRMASAIGHRALGIGRFTSSEYSLRSQRAAPLEYPAQCHHYLGVVVVSGTPVQQF